MKGCIEERKTKMFSFLIFFLLKLCILHWSVADQQCCGSFRRAAMGLSRSYACNHSPPNSPPIQAVT